MLPPLAELAAAVAAGEVVVPIQRTYPLDDVRAAFTELEAGHTGRGDRPHPLTARVLRRVATAADPTGRPSPCHCRWSSTPVSCAQASSNWF